MKQHAERAVASLEGVSFEAYLDCEAFRLATECRLEIIAHDYGEIEDELIRRVGLEFLPPWIESLVVVLDRHA